jgi:hypothetical protein
MILLLPLIVMPPLIIVSLPILTRVLLLLIAQALKPVSNVPESSSTRGVLSPARDLSSDIEVTRCGVAFPPLVSVLASSWHSEYSQRLPVNL